GGGGDATPPGAAQLRPPFARSGFSTPLRAVRSGVDADGQPLNSFALEVTPVSDPAAVYQVNRMLLEVMEHGSGRPARAWLPPGLTVAGKAGTSSDCRGSGSAGLSGSPLAVVRLGHGRNPPTRLP